MKRWFILPGIVIILALLIMHLGTGCGRKSDSTKEEKQEQKREQAQEQEKSSQSVKKESTETESASEKEAGIEVPDASGGLQLGFEPGDVVADFKLETIEGTEVSLFELLENKPVLLEFGAYT